MCVSREEVLVRGPTILMEKNNQYRSHANAFFNQRTKSALPPTPPKVCLYRHCVLRVCVVVVVV